MKVITPEAVQNVSAVLNGNYVTVVRTNNALFFTWMPTSAAVTSSDDTVFTITLYDDSTATLNLPFIGNSSNLYRTFTLPLACKSIVITSQAAAP